MQNTCIEKQSCVFFLNNLLHFSFGITFKTGLAVFLTQGSFCCFHHGLNCDVYCDLKLYFAHLSKLFLYLQNVNIFIKFARSFLTDKLVVHILHSKIQ